MILSNKIKTPDGTTLTSRHRHDYQSYTDNNGNYYAVDGGLAYLRRGYDKKDYTELSVHSSDPHKKIRENFERGSRGKDGNQPLTYILLKDMSDEYLDAVIAYEEEQNPNSPYIQIYKNEKEYRK